MWYVEAQSKASGNVDKNNKDLLYEYTYCQQRDFQHSFILIEIKYFIYITTYKCDIVREYIGATVHCE